MQGTRIDRSVKIEKLLPSAGYSLPPFVNCAVPIIVTSSRYYHYGRISRIFLTA